MKKKELLKLIENFDDDSDVVFVKNIGDLLHLDAEGMDISDVAEINNGEQKVIALVE